MPQTNQLVLFSRLKSPVEVLNVEQRGGESGTGALITSDYS